MLPQGGFYQIRGVNTINCNKKLDPQLLFRPAISHLVKFHNQTQLLALHGFNKLLPWLKKVNTIKKFFIHALFTPQT